MYEIYVKKQRKTSLKDATIPQAIHVLQRRNKRREKEQIKMTVSERIEDDPYLNTLPGVSPSSERLVLPHLRLTSVSSESMTDTDEVAIKPISQIIVPNKKMPQVMWRVKLHDAIPATAFSIVRNKCLVGRDNGELITFHMATGEQCAVHKYTSSIVSLVSIPGGTTVVGMVNGSWKTMEGKNTLKELKVVSKTVCASPYAIYLKCYDHMVGIDIKNGERIWTHPCTENVCSMIADNNHIYYTTHSGDLSAIHLETGATLWKQPNRGTSANITSQDDGHLYICHFALFKINKVNGSIVSRCDAFIPWIVTHWRDGIVFAADACGACYLIDMRGPTGAILTAFEPNGIRGKPCFLDAIGDQVILGTDAGDLVSFVL